MFSCGKEKSKNGGGFNHIYEYIIPDIPSAKRIHRLQVRIFKQRNREKEKRPKTKIYSCESKKKKRLLC